MNSFQWITAYQIRQFKKSLFKLKLNQVFAEIRSELVSRCPSGWFSMKIEDTFLFRYKNHPRMTNAKSYAWKHICTYPLQNWINLLEMKKRQNVVCIERVAIDFFFNLRSIIKYVTLFIVHMIFIISYRILNFFVSFFDSFFQSSAWFVLISGMLDYYAVYGLFFVSLTRETTANYGPLIYQLRETVLLFSFFMNKSHPCHNLSSFQTSYKRIEKCVKCIKFTLVIIAWFENSHQRQFKSWNSLFLLTVRNNIKCPLNCDLHFVWDPQINPLYRHITGACWFRKYFILRYQISLKRGFNVENKDGVS